MTTHDKPSDRVESVVVALCPKCGKGKYENFCGDGFHVSIMPIGLDYSLPEAVEIEALRTRAETAEAECLEQARLLGMSAERELALRAEVERWKRVAAGLSEAESDTSAELAAAEALLAAMQAALEG
jgi:hypothetical protein